MASPMPISPRRAAASCRRCAPRARPAKLSSLDRHRRRLDSLLAEGVTTVEIKSGYGLDVETELKMLKVARKLGDAAPRRCRHELSRRPYFPRRISRRPRRLCRHRLRARPCPLLPKQGLPMRSMPSARALPSPSTRRRRSSPRRKNFGLPVKLHAEQLSNLGGAKLAARYGALSVDHIEYLDEDGVAAIAQLRHGRGAAAGRLLLSEREAAAAGCRACAQHKVPIAIATDLNPGSSPVHSLLTTMNMACVLFGLTPEEALRGVTANAARALGPQGPRRDRAGHEGRSRSVECRAARRPRLSLGLQSLAPP